GHCDPVSCYMHCEHGFEVDERGCDVCQCKEAPPKCSPFQCLMYCENGFERDANGCEICKCKTQCNPITC
ncbi:hypothetical protein CAPTEDRAFT_69907, partial [Capitella teleta]